MTWMHWASTSSATAAPPVSVTQARCLMRSKKRSTAAILPWPRCSPVTVTLRAVYTRWSKPTGWPRRPWWWLTPWRVMSSLTLPRRRWAKIATATRSTSKISGPVRPRLPAPSSRSTPPCSVKNTAQCLRVTMSGKPSTCQKARSISGLNPPTFSTRPSLKAWAASRMPSKMCTVPACLPCWVIR